jgi:hypothetical protein
MRHMSQRAGRTRGALQACFAVAKVDPQREGEVLDPCTTWMVIPTGNDLETQGRECVAERQGDLFAA